MPCFAPPYNAISALAGSQTTTTWGGEVTETAAKYGNAAWSSLWSGFKVADPPFTTTASVTPVPKSELVKPTPLPFNPDFESTDIYRLPRDFIFGFAGSAIQVEGASNREGRGPTITENILENVPPFAEEDVSPDISSLNYYLYKQDIARLAAAGVQSYSFSISWSRILPFGVAGSPVNKQGMSKQSRATASYRAHRPNSSTNIQSYRPL